MNTKKFKAIADLEKFGKPLFLKNKIYDFNEVIINGRVYYQTITNGINVDLYERDIRRFFSEEQV